jgi:Tfp pilus assembly protein PilV
MGPLPQLKDEEGFALLEVIVSAALLAVMVIAVFTTFDVTNRVSARDKMRAVAASLAQDEQERLRSMPVRLLSSTMADKGAIAAPTSPYSVDKVPYKITSTVSWLRDDTQSTSCTTNGAAADYMKIVTTVAPTANSFATKPVTVSSVVTPPGGAFGAGQGSYALTVVGADGNGKSGVNVSLSGVGAGVTRVTDTAGCAFFGYQPVGNYTATVAYPGYVDRDGNTTATVPATIAAEAMSTASVKYDAAGSITTNFVTQKLAADGSLPTTNNATDFVTSKSRYVTLANSGMSAAKQPGSATAASASFTNASLFPFSDGYAIYAGNCTGARPTTQIPAIGSRPAAPVNQVATAAGATVNVLVPAISFTVLKSGTDPTKNQLQNAKVRLTPTSTGCAGTFDLGGPGAVTQANGRVADPGTPFGTYSYCVQGDLGDGQGNRFKKSVIDIDDTGAAGAKVVVSLAGASKGTCP